MISFSIIKIIILEDVVVITEDMHIYEIKFLEKIIEMFQTDAVLENTLNYCKIIHIFIRLIVRNTDFYK